MIFRLLLLFLIVWFLFWIIKKQISGKNTTEPKLSTQQAEDMIACDYCGTHVPKSLVVQSEGKKYCCQDHAELDEQ